MKMREFEISTPTRVIFGRGKENEVGWIIKDYHPHKVLIHYGQGSVIRSGLLASVEHSLQEAEVDYIKLGGVEPNPDVSLVREAIQLVKKEQVDFILALGGGSVIDSAKLIAVGIYYDGDPFDISLHKVEPEKSLPLGVILTIAAAGSEMSTSCVISSREQGIKMGFNSQLNRPLFAIENPELTYKVPRYQLAAGITDIMMHTLERYFNQSDEIEFSDFIAEGLLRSVIVAGRKAMEDPLDYNARGTLMLASSYSHNGITSMGKLPLMPVHQMEHVLSAYDPNITHGAGLAVLFPAWAKYYQKIDGKKFAQFSHNVLSIDTGDIEQDSLAAVDFFTTFFRDLGMPTSLKDFKITSQEIDVLVEHLFKGRTTPIFHFLKPMDEEVAEEIYSLAL
jgi:alcohol dehydrogenase YqhD (iron-dependent ADH family)